MADDEIFIEGMRLLLQHVEEELTRAESDHQRLVEAVTLARAKVDALEAKRNKIVAALTAKAEELPAAVDASSTATAVIARRPLTFGRADPAWTLPGSTSREPQTRRAWRSDLVRRIENLLRPGRPLATRTIFEELVAQGVDFDGIKNPVHRLVQIMSETQHFHADRKQGWSLSSAPFPSIDNAALAGAPEPGDKGPAGQGGLEL
jgi:enoyl reductase-like protein